jgi:hypothetical protein
VTKVRMQAAAAVLVAAGAGVAIVAAAPGSATPASQTISFTEHQTSDQNFNLGSGHGIAVGAVELSANSLMQGSKQIGRDGVSCTITRLSAQSADDLCSDTLALANGQIDLAGLVPSTPQGPGTFQLAVTGGTGRYQHARGYATVAPSQDPKVTVHLTS